MVEKCDALKKTSVTRRGKKRISTALQPTVVPLACFFFFFFLDQYLWHVTNGQGSKEVQDRCEVVGRGKAIMRKFNKLVKGVH